ncbi:MJ0042-type zinc finger domain-containing protein [Bradyrhizobium sp.]|uniref:MJ0042-type zinc finger domain-containing protein n=1 Tax=Bradyrhizobium sp. TaxID=376 RepID=UPI00271927D3|nr:MJ0042-type zinc finger domain-containing protein [Bradyrhizobium sp.]MDO9295692.1 zinc-ribbon domain-containing protein [Bradyrhizobium sp.]
MHIICPHCTTSYAINLATLGAAGRTVRCSRCKEVWLARPEDARELAVPVPAVAQASAQAGADDTLAEWEAMAAEDDSAGTPVVDSPSISADWPSEASPDDANWPSIAGDDIPAEDARPQRRSWFRKLFRRRASQAQASRKKSFVSPALACAGMGALVVALLIWRVEVVRLLPQTADFYRMVGLEVNLRGLMFKDVKITSETVDGKPVLVIEGVITGEAKRPVQLPRLRFSVRDAQGAEIYAWNAVLEQPVLKPGERAWFKSRLASPPPEGRNIDVRFFHKRDIAGGNV